MTVYGETDKVSQRCLYITVFKLAYFQLPIPLLLLVAFILVVDIHNDNSVFPHNFVLCNSNNSLLHTGIEEKNNTELFYYAFLEF